MNQLDIEHINAQSPYIVEEADEENFFKFFTEHDVHYSVGFMPDDILMQSEAYHLIIVRNDNPRLVEVIAEFTSMISLLNQKP